MLGSSKRYTTRENALSYRLPWARGFRRWLPARRARLERSAASGAVGPRRWVSACVIGLTAVALWSVARHEEPPVSPPYSELHRALIAEVGTPQSLRGRLSGFPEGEEPEGRPDSRRPGEVFAFAGVGPGHLTNGLLRVEVEVERTLSAGATPGDLATAGALKLLEGRAEEAVSLLERAVAASPRDGRILSDLALARRELALRQRAPHLLVSALEAALQAVGGETPPPEARFNLALALEDLGLWAQAQETWEEYVEEDPGSRWGGAARRRSEALARRLEEAADRARNGYAFESTGGRATELDRRVAHRPAAARLHVQDRLFERWAKEVLDGDGDRAGDTLAELRRFGRSLAKVTGDRLIEDSVRVIPPEDRVPGHQDGQALAIAHAAYAEGLSTTTQEGCDAPEAPLPTAEAVLDRAGSPFAGWVAVERAVCAYYGGDYREAWRHLGRASRIAARGQYTALAGRVLWISGLVSMVEGDLARSLRFYEDAVRRFEELGETEHAAYLHSLIAKDLQLLGAPAEAWGHRLVGLRGRHRVPGIDRSYTILQEAAEAVQGDKRHPLAAAAYLNELVAVVETVESSEAPDLLPFALLDRAEAAAELGQMAAAQRDLQRATEELAILPPNFQLLPRLSMARAVTEGVLEADSDPEKALARLTTAVEFFRGTAGLAGERVELLRAVTMRGALLRRLGRAAEAEADLAEGLREAERQGAELRDPQLKIEYRRKLEQLYREMVELQLDQGRPELALGYLERSRTRRFWAATGRGPEPSEADEGQGRQQRSIGRFLTSLPEEVHVLVYAALDDYMAVWQLGATGASAHTVQIGRDELRHQVGALGSALKGRAPEADVRRLAGRLFEVLIPEEIRNLPPSATLLIVPGPELWSVPFTVLWDGDGDRYLGESHSLVTLPAAGLLELLAEEGGEWIPPRSAAIVADPAFDRSRWYRLARLPGAMASVEGVRQVFPDARVLTGEEATGQALLALLGEAEMVQFAGHAVAGPDGTGAQGLLVAPSHLVPEGQPGAGDLVTPADIAGSIRGVRLLMLEGCRTAVGYRTAAQDVGTLAGAMVAAGVPAVIATLWNVDDAGGQEYSRELYDALATGAAPPEAVRRTVASLATGSESPLSHPADWAAYVLVGYPYPGS